MRRAQFVHLLDISNRPGLTIQITPFLTGASYAAPGSFSILRFATDDLPDVVYIEQLTGALYLDQRLDVEHYLEVADQLSGEALTPAASRRFIEQVAKEA